jgi:hypothetical protein
MLTYGYIARHGRVSVRMLRDSDVIGLLAPLGHSSRAILRPPSEERR